MRIVHFELPADDPARCMTFYQTAFGWRFEKWDGPMDYWMVKTGDGPGIDGGLARREQPGQPPTNVIALPSVDEVVTRGDGRRRHGNRAEDGHSRRRLVGVLPRHRGQPCSA